MKAPTNIGVFLCPGGRSIFLGQKTKDKGPAALKDKGRKTHLRSVSFEVVINFPRRRGMKGEDDKTKAARPAALKDKGRKTLLRSVSFEG